MSSNNYDDTNTTTSPNIMHSRKQPSSQTISISMPEMTSDETTDDNNDRESETLLPLHHPPKDAESPSKDRTGTAVGGPSQATKIGTALFYAVSSLGVIFANKIVLSTYAFPSVQTLAFLQFASTTLALKVASALGYITLLPISVRGVKSILPLSTCYLLNILTGLSATQNLSLPMMVLLRRASILMTMVSNEVSVCCCGDWFLVEHNTMRLALMIHCVFQCHFFLPSCSKHCIDQPSCWRNGC